MKDTGIKSVEVSWADSTALESWTGFDEALKWAAKDETGFIWSLGHLIEENENYIVIVRDIDRSDMNVSGILKIPRSAIRSVREIS
jgi:hypothetical protein